MACVRNPSLSVPGGTYANPSDIERDEVLVLVVRGRSRRIAPILSTIWLTVNAPILRALKTLKLNEPNSTNLSLGAPIVVAFLPLFWKNQCEDSLTDSAVVFSLIGQDSTSLRAGRQLTVATLDSTRSTIAIIWPKSYISARFFGNSLTFS